MAITIRGIKITSLTVSQDEEGNEQVSADYQLVSSVDKVLAKNSLNSKQGYGRETFNPSPQTKRALADAVTLYKKDVELSLGLDVT